jgi:carbon starvation protein
MMSAYLVLISLVIYIVLYYTYGKGLEKKVVKADSERPTPAHKMYDGVDYVPAHQAVLYGHHFASIAGAGPIVGPAMAMAWGWLPSILWIWFGNIFIGAVHDYLALMSSVRYDGKSIQWIAGRIVGKRTGITFPVYIWFTLVLVIAAFTAVVSNLFHKIPQAATASILFLIVAVILGFLMYKVKLNFYVSTVIGIVLLVASLFIGFNNPLLLDYNTWNIFLFVYIIIASALPVWVLLQPRDYLNAYILWFGLLTAGIAFIALAKPFEGPAFTTFSAVVIGGQPSPFWPAIPLVIACGALSGFHSLVGSGTSSKQLDKEVHGLIVGYGGMFTEGFLSTIVIVSIAVYGVTVTGVPAVEWGTGYAAKGGLSAFVASYAKGFSQFYGYDETFWKTFATLWISAFALTSLDTAARLGRFTWQEIFEPLYDKNRTLHNIIANRWVASAIAAALGVYMAWYGGYKLLWPAFAGMNQLLASIAMITAAVWVAKVQRPAKVWNYAILIPALFLWVTVTVGIGWYVLTIPIKDPLTNILVKSILVIGLILNFILIADFVSAYRKPAEEFEAAPT